jgi:hypothetical protein
VARPLGKIVSNRAGCRLDVTISERFLIGGVDEPIERLGLFRTGGQEPDVVDHDQFGADDPLDDLAG